MKVIIRTDSSHLIGTGHVVRCLTLAKYLRSRGDKIKFVCRRLPGMIVDLIRSSDIEVHLIGSPIEAEQNLQCKTNDAPHGYWLPVSEQQDAMEFIEVAQGLGHADWIIVDHYALTEVWEKQVLNSFQTRLFFIDDLADRKHHCDILLDACSLNERNPYAGLVPNHTQVYQGPLYAILRSQFISHRPKEYRSQSEIRSVMVFSGGRSYPEFLTLMIETLSSDSFKTLHKHFVIPDFERHAFPIQKNLLGIKNVHVHRRIDNMAEFMSHMNLYIGSGGLITWERFCVGLPGLVVSVADNQTAISKTLGDLGYQIYLGESSKLSVDQLSQELVRICGNPNHLNECGRKAFDLVDGRGIERVYQLMSPEIIELNRATLDDVDLTHKWRNHPRIREQSREVDEISSEMHGQWFRDVLNDPERILLIASCKSAPVGVLRFDCDGNHAEISIYLNPDQMHQGLGVKVLRSGESWLQSNRPEISEIKAVIKSTNVASIKSFAKAGYMKRGEDYFKKVGMHEF